MFGSSKSREDKLEQIEFIEKRNISHGIVVLKNFDNLFSNTFFGNIRNKVICFFHSMPGFMSEIISIIGIIETIIEFVGKSDRPQDSQCVFTKSLVRVTYSSNSTHHQIIDAVMWIHNHQKLLQRRRRRR